MDFEQQLRDEIAEMETALAKFVEQANAQVAAQQGGIAALRRVLDKLIAPEGDESDATGEG